MGRFRILTFLKVIGQESLQVSAFGLAKNAFEYGHVDEILNFKINSVSLD